MLQGEGPAGRVPIKQRCGSLSGTAPIQLWLVYLQHSAHFGLAALAAPKVRAKAVTINAMIFFMLFLFLRFLNGFFSAEPGPGENSADVRKALGGAERAVGPWPGGRVRGLKRAIERIRQRWYGVCCKRNPSAPLPMPYVNLKITKDAVSRAQRWLL